MCCFLGDQMPGAQLIGCYAELWTSRMMLSERSKALDFKYDRYSQNRTWLCELISKYRVQQIMLSGTVNRRQGNEPHAKAHTSNSH